MQANISEDYQGVLLNAESKGKKNWSIDEWVAKIYSIYKDKNRYRSGVYLWLQISNEAGQLAENIRRGQVTTAVKENIVHVNEGKRAAGFMQLERARVRWFLSVDVNDLPKEAKAKGQRTYRSIMIDGHEIEFSDGFADLHTRCYEEILNNNRFGLDEAQLAVETVHTVRNASPIGLQGEYHPFCKGQE